MAGVSKKSPIIIVVQRFVERIFGYLSPLIALVALFIIQMQLSAQVANHDISFVIPPVTKTQAPHPDMIKLMSFGYWPAVVDWLWIQVLVDPGITDVKGDEHAPSFYYLKLISELDPQNFDAYAFGTGILSVIRRDVGGAMELLKKSNAFRKDKRSGLLSYPVEFQERYWKNQWMIPFTMGYLYWYEFKNIPEAGKAFTEAADLPGAPRYLQEMKRRMEYQHSQYDAGIRFFQFLVEFTEDGALKKAYQEQLQSLIIGQFLYEVNQKWKTYLSRNPSSLPKSEELFRKFLIDSKISDRDPAGGKLFLTRDQKILSETPRSDQFGLEF